MPLEKGSSKAAFSKNVATEVNAGKPTKQAVAIAYRESGKDCAMPSDGRAVFGGRDYKPKR